MIHFGQLFQALALDVLHHHVIYLAVIHHRIKNFYNMRMRQLACQRGFTEQQLAVSLGAIVVDQYIEIEEFYCDLVPGCRIQAEEHRAGRTVTQLSDDFVFANFVHKNKSVFHCDHNVCFYLTTLLFVSPLLKPSDYFVQHLSLLPQAGNGTDAALTKLGTNT